MDTSKENKLSNLFDNLFKFLFLAFWTLFLFTDIIFTDSELSLILFSLYNFLLLSYITIYLLVIFNFKMYNDKIIVYYRLSTLLAFLFTSYSFFMFPTNIILFVLKLVFITIYMYVSIIKLYKHKMDEGVVGITSASLIIVVLLCSS